MNDYEESSVENDTATQKADEVSSIDYRTSGVHYPQFESLTLAHQHATYGIAGAQKIHDTLEAEIIMAGSNRGFSV